ncbi:hsp70 family protein [Gigaspora margarita]|uniref:Hsp70 family protein n=1 Tax=Gigaspora margarita TaxID=4874 RepID=A0A8H4AMB8_GIGMA|nr:hsp70 family protein [Gigaspora margarita]
MDSFVKVNVIINSYSPVEMALDINSTLYRAHSLIIKKLGPSSNDSRYKFFFKFLGAELVDSQSSIIKISDIIDQNCNVIYVKRELYIKVNIDNSLSMYYDLGSLYNNLLNVRKILRHNPIMPISFKFVSGRRLISEAEEKHHVLREILGDSDELFIYPVDENSYKNVTICKYLQLDNNIKKYMEFLPITEKLIQVRTLLKMGPNLVFYDGDIKIDRSLETSIDWINIAWIEDENLKLKVHQENDQEWNELVSQCDIGFTFEADRFKLAKSQSFTIDITKIKPELEKGLYSGNAIFKCEQKFNKSFNEQLTLNGGIAPSIPLPYLPYLSLLANVSYESSESRNVTTKFSSVIISKAKVNLDETNIILDNDFIEEVKAAVVNNHPRNEKVKELKRISKKYGHFYASEVVFGGAIIENYKNIRTQANDSNSIGIEAVCDFELIHTEGEYESDYTTSRTINISNEVLTIIGGDEILFVNNDPEAIRLWKNLFNNSKYWKIISYKILPIFDLLDSDLKNQVLEAFGEQILKVGTITHYPKLLSSNLTPIVIDDWSNGKFEDVTSNPLQCQIFASIMNKDNCIYSLRIEYIDKDTPAFVIHYIGRRKKPKKIIDCKIHIGWIIVGYPERFIFERRNHDIKITKKKCEKMTRVKIDDHISYKCDVDQFFNHSSKLGICVIEGPLESSNYDIYESKMVTDKWTGYKKLYISKAFNEALLFPEEQSSLKQIEGAIKGQSTIRN